jgi:hypothetical protein
MFLAAQLVAGLPEELPATLRGAQLLGQLIATILTMQLVLGRIGRLRLLEDLTRDLLD